ncbi:GlxA family transcriptional regulator [Mesorhizobium sp. M1C.F.Ca.ET.193.01.1.1]|uniref:GlxA family transcriptional regulator n=2 Tax=Mesorhizobium TaxID=68287 RepID=UPI000FD2F308|nr:MULTISPECIES: GlxA family transcriptional regulator [unclassified Mesorhizobium]TGT02251.1 GlxA family transcriptional regulator [bacterium M00.F.Ca.ET.177.01.1.1]TGQ54504.1 GlxA family transcriptional regulator [Mesorhizobium sp. M1C.F.Ca.ET.210.01.1.1]TGQ72500.1 GlxA family transcriptional regulator [Mesorhizobium sp. M1C.F.Ca.ET.212.01.1.1]TGR10296.1 GlxA family transcriptional regulator [Mesorhizobium sp. M1C.F.Ca.ET.204.01.1.1]TGR30899.1 GlxA family transcriptional regulator [Mesorhizo
MNAPTNISAMKALTASETAAAVARPFEVAVLALPGFSHLALHAYIEPLRIANAVSRLPLFRWQIVGTSRQPIEGANGLSVAVDASTDELSAGIGDCRADQLAVIAGEAVEKQLTPQLNAFLRATARRGVPISALGTAPWLLAQAGLLANIRCTIHWSRLAAFSEVFHKPRIRDSLFVKDGQYSTCAGELAAFDLAVDLIGGHAGGFIAQEVCRHATVEGQRSGSNRQTGPSGLAFAGVSDKLVLAMRIMEENVERPLPVDEVAQRAGISRRQLERLFGTYIGLPPVRHYLRIRVDHAKRLIEGTRLPIIDIAVACGFMSTSHFAKCFRAFNGTSPQQCRAMVPAWVGPGLG